MPALTFTDLFRTAASGGTPSGALAGVHTCRIPALVSTADGKLVASFEGRIGDRVDEVPADTYTMRIDPADRSILSGPTLVGGMVRGSDGWIVGNPTLVRLATGRILLFLHRRPAHTTTAAMPATNDPATSATLWVCRSDDHGAAFGNPIDITAGMKLTGKGTIHPGPGVAIQLTSGRIAVPVWQKNAGANSGYVCVCVYTDDATGESGWTLGGTIPGASSETQFVQRTDGSILATVRVIGTGAAGDMWSSVSTDGGLTWSALSQLPATTQPGVMCGLAPYGNRLLFTHPHDSSARRYLTIRYSANGGAAWNDPTVPAGNTPVGTRVTNEGSGYSCPAADPRGPDLGVWTLFERGTSTSSPYDRLTLTHSSDVWLGIAQPQSPGSAMFAQDAFTGTAGVDIDFATSGHVASDGGQWSRTAGGIIFTNANRVRHNGGATPSLYVHSSDPSGPDYTVGADIYHAGTGGESVPGVVARATGTTFYHARFSKVSPGAVQIYRSISGSLTLLTTTPMTMSAGETKRLELTVEGTGSAVALAVTWGGSPLLSFSDTHANRIVTTGKAGLRIAGTNVSDTNGVHVDNFAASDPVEPLVPGTLSLDSVGHDSATLSWTGATGGVAPVAEQLQRAPDDDGSPGGWEDVPAATASPHADTGLDPETRYHWRVEYTDDAETSVLSNVVDDQTDQAPAPIEASPGWSLKDRLFGHPGKRKGQVPVEPPPPGAPAAPSGLTATSAGQDQINLTWTDNSSDEDGFTIQRSLTGLAWTTVATKSANATSHSDTGLDPETSYQYRVRAFSSNGESAWSNTATATTAAVPAPEAPVAPSNLVATYISDSQVNLAWTDNSNNEDGFTIERSPGGSEWAEIATRPANATTYGDTGLTAETEYHYRVRAYNTAGTSAWSGTATITTLAAGAIPPGAIVIDSAWKTANAADTNLGPARDPAKGPFILKGAGSTYWLAEDVETLDTAFVVADANIKLHGNGKKIRYDLGGVAALQPVFEGRTRAETVAMLGFETQGTGGTTAALGWDLGTSGLARVAQNQYGFHSDLRPSLWTLYATGVNSNRTILSDPIVLPRAGIRYAAAIAPYGSSTMAVPIRFVDADNPATLLSTSHSVQNAGTHRQHMYRTTYVATSDNQRVRIRIELAPAAGTSQTIRLDNARCERRGICGIWAASSVTGRFAAHLDPWESQLNRGNNFQLIGPGELEQVGTSMDGDAIYASAAKGLTVTGCDLQTRGMTSGIVSGPNIDNLTFTDNTFGSMSETVYHRQANWALVNVNGNGTGPHYIARNTITPGTVCHIPIGVWGKTATTSAGAGIVLITATIEDNVLDGWYSLAADGYGVCINANRGTIIRRNSIKPLNGRGILQDGFGSTASEDVHVYENDIDVRERGTLEYHTRNMESTGIRIREFGDTARPWSYHKRMVVRNNTIVTRTFAGVAIGSSGYPTAPAVTGTAWNRATKGIALTLSRSDSVAGLEWSVRIHDNDVTATCELDASLKTHAYPLAMLVQTSFNGAYWNNNIFRSNYTCVTIGDYDGWSSTNRLVVVANSTFEKLSSPTGMIFKTVFNWADNNSIDNLIASPTYLGGATEEIAFSESGLTSGRTGSTVSFGWHLTITVSDPTGPVSGATVAVTDSAAVQVASGVTNASGVVVLPVPRTTYTHTGGGSQTTTDRAPLAVAATQGGRTNSVTSSPTADAAVPILLPAAP
jgi:hypothetical protein